jgi:hypothetical protein
MSQARAREPLPETLDEFVAWHKQQPERWEFIAGAAMMVEPVSLVHALVEGNAHLLLHEALDRKGCQVLLSGPEVRSVNLAAIPDVTVARRPVDQTAPALRNPVALVEVDSPERDHRLALKWRQYRLIPSLQFFLRSLWMSVRRRSILVWTAGVGGRPSFAAVPSS